MSHTATRVAALLAVLAVVLPACSSSKPSSARPPVSAGHLAAESPPSAQSVVNRLEAAGLAVVAPIVYTAANDPNSLLGRPGQYTSKASWKIPGVDDDPAGSVEVFATSGEAQARARYIQSIRSGGILGTEYDYLSGGVLLRLSGQLTPAQAQAYAAAAGGMTLFRS